MRTDYSHGHYNYAVTITFKPDSVYAVKALPVAYGLFRTHFRKYMQKKHIAFYLCNELGTNGRYHLHGILCFKAENNNYKEHDKQLRLVKNYFLRNYGITEWQQITDLWGEYTVTNMRFYIKSHTLKTTLKQVVDYMTKDINDYSFWKPINIHPVILEEIQE